MSSEQRVRSPRLSTHRLLLCGVVAGPLTITVFTVLGALRPDYDPLRHPVSSLSLTDAGWAQILNFLVTAALFLLFAVGAHRALQHGVPGHRMKAGATPWFLGVCGVGLIGAGIFLGDPLSGYPPGAPDEVVNTAPGIAHAMFALVFFLGIPLACASFAVWCVRTRRWGLAAYSVVSAIGFFVFFLFFLLGGEVFVGLPGFVELNGLNQRICVIIGFAWTTVLGLVLIRVNRDAESRSGKDIVPAEPAASTAF